MGLFQNLIITVNARKLFWTGRLFLWYQIIGLYLAKQLMSPQKIIVISKAHYLDFLVSCLYTFNPLSLSLKWWWTWLKQHTKKIVERRKSHKRVKGSERRPFIFKYCSARFISDRWNCHGNWGMETKSCGKLCQKL